MIEFDPRQFVWQIVSGICVQAVGLLVLALSWIDRLFDEFVINLGFNKVSEAFRESARYLSRFQNGQVHRYLRLLGLSITVLAFFFLWGCRR